MIYTRFEFDQSYKTKNANAIFNILKKIKNQNPVKNLILK
jgi:hypothetical protein